MTAETSIAALSRITFRAYPPKPIFNPANPTECQFNCTNELNYFAHTVGFGLRYSTPVGPIRIDLGFPINRPQFVAPICPNGDPRASMDITDSKARDCRDSRSSSTWGQRSDAPRLARIFGLAVVLLAGTGTSHCVRRKRRRSATIDRIVARVDTDIILLSDVRALERYQQLVDGKSETDAQILDRLIDQWIVRNEADTAQFPHPTADAIDHGRRARAEIFHFARRIRSQEEADRPDATAMSARWSRRNCISSNYLDSRFRPSVHVEAKDMQEFYEKAVMPRAQARGQDAPSLDAARDFIHDALIQRSIDEQSDRWLTESRCAHRRGKNAGAGDAMNAAAPPLIWSWMIHTPWVLAVLCILAQSSDFLAAAPEIR